MIRTLRGLRDQRGEISLTALLVGMLIFGIVLGAVLTTFEQFTNVNKTTEVRLEVQDKARQAVDRVAKDLRNIASPTTLAPQAIDKASATDIVVRTVNPKGPISGTNATNVMRVRYCLDTSTTPGKLWVQRQTWTTDAVPASPSTGTCPASGWTSQALLADSITNGSARPVFAFNNSDTTAITAMHVDLYVDTKIGDQAKETRISSGVNLRNQNRRPTAVFNCTKGSQGLILNASGTTDPENDPLTYTWYQGSDTSGTQLGSGIVFTWATTTGGAVTLQVKDTADLKSTATKTVNTSTCA